MVKKQRIQAKRRIIALIIFLLTTIFFTYTNDELWQAPPSGDVDASQVQVLLGELEVKGRAPRTGYSREEFGRGWQTQEDGCDTRNKILKRDLRDTTENENCQILTGTLLDPYTDEDIEFSRTINASAVQIDHVVALSDAWQKGAQSLDFERRVEFSNDPLNLLAVDGPANQQKGDSDAASWLPANRAFRCQYIDRQVRVKHRYNLWVTDAEKTAIERVLSTC